MNPSEERMLDIVNIVEKQIDEQLERFESYDSRDYMDLYEQRLKKLKEKQAQQLENVKLGHGKYEEIPDEKSFFGTIKKSSNVLCLFYTDESARSKIMHMHLKKLAPKHLETKFCFLNIEKCPFLAKKIPVTVVPTFVAVKDQQVVNRYVGFTTLGNCDDFSTELLEWVIAQSKVIDYEGDLACPPEAKAKKAPGRKKTIQGKEEIDSDEEFFTYDAPAPEVKEELHAKLSELRIIQQSENCSDDELESD